MKHARQFMALALALVMALALTVTASAQTAANPGEDKGTATITIRNAAKGETYKVVKLFDAAVAGTENGPITYTGTIPESLSAYFEADDNGYITAKADTLSPEAIAAMKAWAESETAMVSAVSDGSNPLVFTGLPYGYYVVTSTQGAAVTVTSTNPNATVVDKNTREPKLEKKVNGKDADEITLGETVTYTASFDTTNFLGEGENAKKVVRYELTDTLPAFLAEVTVTSVTVDGTPLTPTPSFADKKMDLPWVDEETGDSLYKNGAKVVVIYTAKVVSTDIVIDGTAGNVNTVTLKAYVENPNGNEPDPWEDTWTDTAKVETFAVAMKKVEKGTNKPLAGATFQIAGLVAQGDNGNYTVISYNPGDSSVEATVMKTDDNGKLVIKGFKTGEELAITEVAAPNGYVLQKNPVTLVPQRIGEEVTVTATTVYYNPDGTVSETKTDISKTTLTYPEKLAETEFVFENVPGTSLPSAGGVGTTLLYLVGLVLVSGAGIALAAKKRGSIEN